MEQLDQIIGSLSIVCGLFLVLFGYAAMLDNMAKKRDNDKELYKPLEKPKKLDMNGLTGKYYYSRKPKGDVLFVQYKKDNKTFYRKATDDDINILVTNNYLQ